MERVRNVKKGRNNRFTGRVGKGDTEACVGLGKTIKKKQKKHLTV